MATKQTRKKILGAANRARLPFPKVQMAGAGKTIDLEELGDQPLLTYVNYPGIAAGQHFWPSWRGCDVDGNPVDLVNDLIEVDEDLLDPVEGMRVYIANDKLKSLDQGVALYSYAMEDTSAPDGRGEESLRLDLYVGVRPSLSALLPVPQCLQSHDLALDIEAVEGRYLTFMIPPYAAMSIGDKVTLSNHLYFDEDTEYYEETFPQTVDAENLGKPLHWAVDKTYTEETVGGLTHISYRIVYATPTRPSQSAKQTLHIGPTAQPLLPELIIKGDEAESLDPEAFPHGMTLVVNPYPGIQVGDDVVVYAQGDSTEVGTLRVDQSTLDSGILEITVSYEWLLANNGQDVLLTYQYARAGAARASLPLPKNVRKPLKLSAPTVDEATEEGEPGAPKGFLLGESITNAGFWVRLPDDYEPGRDDKIQLVLDGYGGKFRIDPTVGDARRFNVPVSQVTINLGKRLDVYYEVTVPDIRDPYSSKRYDLQIKHLSGTILPTIQITDPKSDGSTLSLAASAQGVTLNLAKYKFMKDDRQRVKIWAEGGSPTNTPVVVAIREGDQEKVTEAEYNAGEIVAFMPFDFLQQLVVNDPLYIYVEISFDDGLSYLDAPRTVRQLVA